MSCLVICHREELVYAIDIMVVELVCVTCKVLHIITVFLKESRGGVIIKGAGRLPTPTDHKELLATLLPFYHAFTCWP